MAVINGYATLAEFKAQQSISGTDATDDGVIESLIERASRYIDDNTLRWFYPSVETRYFDVPDGRELSVDADLCAVSSITNGDGTTIANTEYKLLDRNRSPYRAIRINETSAYSWTSDSTGNTEQVIAITGTWCYRSEYDRRGWANSSATLSTAITGTSALTFTCTTGKLSAGQIIKVDDEIMIVSSVAASTNDTITVMARGDNGSTAATHLISAVVYIWKPQPDIAGATLDMAISKYKRLYGENTSGTVKVTAAGVVIMPSDVPDQVQSIIHTYARKL